MPLVVAGLLGLAFFVSLVASLPASVAAGYVVPPVKINGYSGTVWAGAAEMAGGHSLRWRVDLPGSLAALGVVLDTGLRGPGTELAGRVTVRGIRGEDLRLDGLSGPVAWPLVAAMAPRLAIACDAAVAVSDVSLASLGGVRSGAGSLRAGPGACVRSGREMTPVPVPALAARLATEPAGVRAVLTRAEAAETPLAEAMLTAQDVLVVTVFAEGAALVPGMPASGETTLEFPLTSLP
jgi:hypothetical protein